MWPYLCMRVPHPTPMITEKKRNIRANEENTHLFLCFHLCDSWALWRWTVEKQASDTSLKTQAEIRFIIFLSFRFFCGPWFILRLIPRPQINGIIIKGLTIVSCCCFCQMRYLNKLLTIKMVNKAHVPIESFIAIFAVSGLNRSFSRLLNEEETFAHACNTHNENLFNQTVFSIACFVRQFWFAADDFVSSQK